MASISIRIKFKSTSQAQGQGKHNDRRSSPDYVDSSKTHLNKQLFKSTQTLPEIDRELKSQTKKTTGRKRQKNTDSFIDGIITFSKDADLKNKTQLDECAKSALEKIIAQNKLVPDALVDLTRHEDESRTHYHFMLKNQTTEHKSARRSFDKFACEKLQDTAGESFKQMGINRGVSKKTRMDNGEPAHKYIHRSVKKLHEDLPKEIEVAEKRLQECMRVCTDISIKPIPIEIVKKKKRLGHDQTIKAEVYSRKQITDFLRTQYTKAAIAEYDSNEAIQALRELDTAQKELDALVGVEKSLKSDLRASRERNDDLERVLHDHGVEKSQLAEEIEKSKQNAPSSRQRSR